MRRTLDQRFPAGPLALKEGLSLSMEGCLLDGQVHQENTWSSLWPEGPFTRATAPARLRSMDPLRFLPSGWWMTQSAWSPSWAPDHGRQLTVSATPSPRFGGQTPSTLRSRLRREPQGPNRLSGGWLWTWTRWLAGSRNRRPLRWGICLRWMSSATAAGRCGWGPHASWEGWRSMRRSRCRRWGQSWACLMSCYRQTRPMEDSYAPMSKVRQLRRPHGKHGMRQWSSWEFGSRSLMRATLRPPLMRCSPLASCSRSPEEEKGWDGSEEMRPSRW